MRVAHVAGLLLLIGLSRVAPAADAAFQCRHDGNQQEMNACAVRDYEAADADLNARYKRVIAALPATKREQLRRDQRAWLKKRDRQCKAEAQSSEGGSIWPLEFFGCLKSATERRIRQLERWQRKR